MEGLKGNREHYPHKAHKNQITPTSILSNYWTFNCTLCLCLLTTLMRLCTTLMLMHCTHVFHIHYTHVFMSYAHVFMGKYNCILCFCY